jgi:hypothetical protein
LPIEVYETLSSASLRSYVPDVDIANIFGTAKLLAEQCGRRDPQSGDVVSALEAVRSESLPVPYPHEEDVPGSSTKQDSSGGSRSRKERRRKRGERLLTEDLIRFIQRDNRLRAQPPDGIPLAGLHSLPLITDESEETTNEPPMLTISDSEDTPRQSSLAGSSKLKVGKKKRKLGYMLDIAPSLPDLPPRHTWKRSLVRLAFMINIDVVNLTGLMLIISRSRREKAPLFPHQHYKMPPLAYPRRPLPISHQHSVHLPIYHQSYRSSIID